jgi:hypothetical protein
LLLITEVALYQTHGTQTPKAHGGGVKLLAGGAGVLDDAGTESASADPDWGAVAGAAAVTGAAAACGVPDWTAELGDGAAVTVFVTVGAGAGFAGVLAACGLPAAASGTVSVVDEGVAHPAAKSAVAATAIIATVLPPRKLVIWVPFPIPTASWPPVSVRPCADSSRYRSGPVPGRRRDNRASHGLSDRSVQQAVPLIRQYA